MSAEQWDRLMTLARKVAGIRRERVRVTGVVQRRNRSWGYVIECESQCPCRERGLIP